MTSYRKHAGRHKGIKRFSETILLMTTFVLIFTVLLGLMNWQAYRKIAMDWLKPREVLADPVGNEVALPSFPTNTESFVSEQLFSLASLGQLYTPDMSLEAPKVFEGIIPVKMVELEKGFQLKDLYASTENSIQKALRDGVVHYPYTANPNQYGNVFITGHSSYYPWDKGRYKDIFALLHKLEKGDRYTIYFEGKPYQYEVFEKFEVQPEDVSVLEQPVDKRISTLMTCTPVGTVLRRLIIRGILI